MAGQGQGATPDTNVLGLKHAQWCTESQGDETEGSGGGHPITSQVGIDEGSLQSLLYWLSLPGGSDGKELACNAGDLGLISGLGRSLGEGNGNSLQYSCLGNPTDRGAWQATIHGAAKSQT